MNSRALVSSARAVGLLLALFVLALQPAAQGSPLPPPSAARVPVNQWVVTLASGADPFEVAGRMGLIVERALDANTYVFRAGNELRPATVETTQTLDTGLARSPEVLNIVQQVLLDRPTRDPSDPLFDNQWHLENTGQEGGTAGEDANVTAAWDLGYTGTGIVVSSVDNGVNHTHSDLSGNYLASASWDYVGNDGDPSGGGHGTAVAGVMAADDDGTHCGVGAAYTAQVSGIRLLGAATDANEADALTYDNQTIDIYNNSWGPSDLGHTLEGPGPLTQAAMADGIANGRGGLGSLYVWASGNGYNNDDVNADGYANSRYVIAVAATSNIGERSVYSEQGSPILINAPSSNGLGFPNDVGITTTAYGTSGCMDNFGGTSSASPLAAGVVALMLQANPDLTWRDVKHILVQTAEKNDPSDSNWFDNGAGLHYNHFYGFGRIDAGAAVALADTWMTVLPEETADSGVQTVNAAIPDGPSGAFVTDTFDVTDELMVESVDVVFDASHVARGQLYVELISPSGTTSILMHGRPDTGDDYDDWRFNTVANWDEVATGTWTIRVKDLTTGTTGTFNSWRLQVHGTSLSDTYITRQPESTDVLFNEAATVEVEAVGGAPITYQWYEGVSGDTSNPIGGATNSTYTTGALTTATQLWVRATGTENSVDSDTTTLTIVGEYDMLLDEPFNIKAPAEWKFSSSEAKIACNKQYVSPVCAAKLVNKDSAAATVIQDVDLGAYPWSLQVGDTLEVTVQAKANPGAKTKLQLLVKYADDTQDKTKQKFTADGVWQPYSLNFTLARADVTRVRVKITDRSVTTGVTVWVDDAQLEQQRDTSRRGGSGVLPPPAAPDGFRGNN